MAVRTRCLAFADLPGWPDDDHAAALSAWQRGAARDQPAGGRAGPSARAFFETHFRPVEVTDGTAGLLTGYYEPELPGALKPDDRFRVPLHAPPPDLAPDRPWHSRAEIEEGALLSGRGLELLWIESEVDRFFLQVQGSGRIRLPDGRLLRIGFAARNGHPYRSIGRILVDDGVFAPGKATAAAIRDWIAADPAAGRALMRRNPSYVFFRVVADLPEELGPVGTAGVPLTPWRSLAVDPAFIPLGTPVWVVRGGDRAGSWLAIAQDTGAAIRGAQRADVFVGTGGAAGALAGAIADPVRLVMLRQTADTGQGEGT
jgi:membrane-bound lytic murein transglycosylase A